VGRNRPAVRHDGVSADRTRLPFPAPIAAAIAIAAAVLVYLPALRNGFVWDDPLVLQQLRAMRSWADLVIMPPQVPRYYYRPLIFVSYLIDRGLGGDAPFWFHASVILVHAFNCLLVYRLALYLFPEQPAIGAAAALLFAVFPTHAESVAWMAGRSDVIVCTFLLLTVLLAVRRDVRWSAWASGVTFFLALLSKEMAVAGLLVIPIIDWLSARRMFWGRYVPLVVASGAYFALRRQSGGALLGGTPVSAMPLDVTLDLLRAFGFYAVRSIVPVGLSPYLPTVPESPIYLATAVLLPLLGAGLFLWLSNAARRRFVLLLAWFVLTLIPSLTVIVRQSGSAPVADRYLYVPSVATCLLIAWAIISAAQWRRVPLGWAFGLVAAVSAVLGVSTATYARVWSNNVTFWTEVASKVPQSALANRELARSLLEEGQLDDAERILRRALTLPSEAEGQVMAYSNLGLIYRRQQRFADAVGAFGTALRIAPHPALYHNLGMTLMAKAEEDQRRGDSAAVLDDVRGARSALESALTLEKRPGGESFLEQWDPAKTHALLGQVLLSLGDRAGAREHFEIALRLEPTGPIADVTRRYLAQIPP
jgi:predicted negative regulator of RcsB-dependent stress response